MTIEDTIFDETGAVAYIRSRAVFSAKTEKIVAFVRGKDLFDLLDKHIGSLSELGPVGSTLPEGLKKLLDWRFHASLVRRHHPRQDGGAN
jgi:hypothetical protein